MKFNTKVGFKQMWDYPTRLHNYDYRPIGFWYIPQTLNIIV